MRPRTALATFLVAGGAAFGVLAGTSLSRWSTTPWSDEAARASVDALGPWTPGMSLRATFDGLPAPDGPPPRLRLLDDNQEAWVERWRLLSAARERVDAASFIVRDDVFGISFLGHLLLRAEQGAKVRLLVDAHGTKMGRSPFQEDYLDELAGAGIDVRIYRPLPARVAQAVMWLSPVAAIASEHDKLLLVDRGVSLMGGRNISSEYFADPATTPDAFKDVDIVIEGRPTALKLERAFQAEWNAGAAEPVRPEELNLADQRPKLLGAHLAMDAWLRGDPARALADPDAAPWVASLHREHPGLLGALHRPPAPTVRAPVRVLDSSPRPVGEPDPVTEGLRRLLASARREVLIQSPYLVLSDAAVEELAAAGARGVRITIITNSPTSSDNAVSQAFFMEQWPELLARVPNLRLFVRGDRHNVHGKTATFDGRVAVVSTYNLDPVSMYVNGEVAVVAWSRRLAARVAEPVEAWIAAGPPQTHEYLIARDAEGRALRGHDGAPVVLFGPRDHSDPDAWPRLAAWWRLLRTLQGTVGFDPIF
ncbi:MAG: phosphatidylserine/phosphatidylglycerophosphate/cardiolipin synthase family protein [Planctomycetes bacterium]|nr:phosphatidylserine/phosphatidylglycerophosphate/cardiolipin synthase family protein [Planctomycetota bacterium]